MEVVELAAAWLEEQEEIISRTGARLSEEGRGLAFLIGVKDPVKVLRLDEVPLPTEPPVKHIMDQVGLTGPCWGLAAGHGIYLAQEADTQTLAHELTHVRQVELLGGIREFVLQYYKECSQYGYYHAPMEIEARVVAKRLCE